MSDPGGFLGEVQQTLVGEVDAKLIQGVAGHVVPAVEIKRIDERAEVTTAEVLDNVFIQPRKARSRVS